MLTNSNCSVMELCTRSNSSATGVSVSSSALYNTFVEAAKRDKTVGVTRLVSRDWSYEDLVGLYIGLLAAAVSAVATAATALMGIGFTYLAERFL
jgi:hypothetical protein